MNGKKTSTLANGLIWFGAGVSIAEILTGTLIAPLGFQRGIAAILLGHLIGGLMMYLVGLIGGLTGKSAMETVKLSFGRQGALWFSSLNVIQLVGWTAVMLISASAAAGSIYQLGGPAGGNALWCLLIGALVVVWILFGIRNLSKVNTVTMSALFILTLILSVVVLRGNTGSAMGGDVLSFGAAVELSAAMPISWLPLISDYTRTAKHPRTATAVSAGVYFLVSCWMYIIGMGAALLTGESDVAVILLQAGLGVAGLLIVVFSTVTTTFLDTYSAGVSAQSISAKFKEKPAALVICLVGTLLAILAPIERFESFLYLIGSVFAPMTAILLADYYILRQDRSGRNFDKLNFVLWLIGFVIYRLFLRLDTLIGNTLPVILLVIVLCLITNKWIRKNAHAGSDF
ncbi:MAG: putative hydroxymethylpyrimidine transporter CytX [Peptococcaceae bacterium]|jgi:putative hydroxymethylpyrimidine transporter CytX|nr:putative hydroxymethylpyrimidine transporter CytX [Peptococcaceae bacterium]